MSLNKSNDEKQLIKLIKTVTNSGLDSIDTSLWENIKILFKKCPPLIDKAFDALMIEFKKPHAQVRLSAMMLCNELFQRSHNFRTNVIQKFEEILEMTAGVNPNRSLPPPRAAADKLKALALRTVLDWKNKFAVKYPAMLDYFHFLERCKNIDFEAVQRDIEADAVAKAEREREQERVRRLMFDSFIEEFNDKEADIEELINVINNCTTLLIPTPDNFFLEHEGNEVSGDAKNENFDMRLFGLRSSYNLEIKINPETKLRVDRNDENAAVIDNLRENVRVAKKRFIALVAKWEDIVKKYSQDSTYVKKVEDLKTRLDACVKKYKDLEIHGCEDDDDDSDDDADMVEVVKEGYEAQVLPIIRETLKAPKSSDPKPSTSKQEPPLPRPSELSEAAQPGPSSRKDRLLALAPKMPYDVDLYHWEDEDVKVPNLVSVHMGNSKFWGGSDAGEVSEIPNPEGIDALRSRVIEFSGEFKPIERTCRALLPSGKLCPRRDRFRCPFHGKILPRDVTGKCANPEDEPTESSTAEDIPEPVPDWQDPELLAQLKASTGIDLKMPEKRKKGVRRKKPALGSEVKEMVKTRNFPGIADVGILKNNPKARLKKKIFNRSAVKRVAEACNKLDRRKFVDKFGDQFNYS